MNEFRRNPRSKRSLTLGFAGSARHGGCTMSGDMMELKKEDFIDGVIDVVSAADFIDKAEGASVISI